MALSGYTDDRYPNQVSKGRRNTMFNQHSYESGPLRDGHKLYREEDNGGGSYVSVVHPPECELIAETTSDRDGATFVLGHYHDCPWTYLVGGTVQEAYELGEDHLDLERLPLHEEVEVWWSFQSGESWTDYGWEVTPGWVGGSAMSRR